MVVADIAALMSSQFKSLAIIIAKRIEDQAWVVWGPLFYREADGWKIGQKRENRQNQAGSRGPRGLLYRRCDARGWGCPLLV